MTDIHNLKKRLERTLEKVKNSPISERNKKAILEFHNFCFSEGIGAGKIQRYVFDLEKIDILMALNWSFWNGLEYPGYCDFACEFRQKFHMSQVACVWMLLVILVICIGLIRWIKKKK